VNTGTVSAVTAHGWQQRLKWTVYALLFLDFVLYFIQDVESAAYTLGSDPSFLDRARAYVTSIDLAAWFILIVFFELETYVRSESLRQGIVKWSMHGVRLLCYVAILHTTMTDAGYVRDFRAAEALPPAGDLCAYTSDDWSFLRNRGYTDLDEDNCATIGNGPDFYLVRPDPVITDRAGLREGRILSWTDLAENVAWLLIILGNEIVVRMHGKSARGGAVLAFIDHAKATLYVLIVCIACYWGSKGQILYFWDELLWVCGFLAIEKNILDWRAQMLGRPRAHTR
jgi:hypothetical protein